MMTYGLIVILKSREVMAIGPTYRVPNACNSDPVLAHLRRAQTPDSAAKVLQMSDS